MRLFLLIADFVFKLEGIFCGMPFIVFVMLVGFYFTAKSVFFTFAKFVHILKHTAGDIGKTDANLL